MTVRCQLCGEPESAQVTITVRAGEVCWDCISELIDSEVERRGVARGVARDEQADGGGLYAAETQRMIEAQRLK